MGRMRSWCLVVGALSVVLAACGDDGSDADADPGGDAADVVPDEPVDGDEGDEGDGEVEMLEGADAPAQPSRGCGSSEVDAGRDEVTMDLTDGDVERWYLRDVPGAHDGETPLPLVVDLHGYAQGAELQAAATGLAELGEDEGFVTVTPHGEGVGGVPMWFAGPGSHDVEFLGHMLDDIEDDLCIDTARVYVAGLSNGARMTSVLACDLADRIAAAAPVAGVGHIEDCAAERPVPVVSFHGTEDTFLLYEGGTGSGADDLPRPEGVGREDAEAASEIIPAVDVSVEEAMARWAERNGCDDGVTEDEIADDVVLLRWDCEPGTEVQLYRIDGGGHSWPGSEFFAGIESVVGTTTMSISADEVMWDFFREQALPGPADDVNS